MGAEGIAPRQAPEFTDEVVRVDVVQPCASHGPSYVVGGGLREDPLDAAQFGDGVHLVLLEGVDQLVLCVFHFEIVEGYRLREI